MVKTPHKNATHKLKSSKKVTWELKYIVHEVYSINPLKNTMVYYYCAWFSHLFDTKKGGQKMPAKIQMSLVIHIWNTNHIKLYTNQLYIRQWATWALPRDFRPPMFLNAPWHVESDLMRNQAEITYTGCHQGEGVNDATSGPGGQNVWFSGCHAFAAILAYSWVFGNKKSLKINSYGKVLNFYVLWRHNQGKLPIFRHF